MNSEEKDLVKKKLEEEFEAILDRGENIRSFLYIPHTMLTEKIRSYLDIFLMEEAYRSISHNHFDTSSFVVYHDEHLKIKLDKKEQQFELIERLIQYFSEKEEYEKCSMLLDLKTKIES